MREQVAEVIDPNATEPFGVYVWADPDPAASLARHVERVVFDESFGNTPEQLDVEYGTYERSSLFLCVIDHRRRLPVGMARAILPSDAGLKSLDDIEREWGEDVDDVLARTGLPMRARASSGTAPPSRRCRSTDGARRTASSAWRCTRRRDGSRPVRFPVVGRGDRRAGAPGAPVAPRPPVRDLCRECARCPTSARPSSMPVWSDLPAWSARLAIENPVKHEIVFGGHGLSGDGRAARLGCGRGAGRGFGRAPAPYGVGTAGAGLIARRSASGTWLGLTAREYRNPCAARHPSPMSRRS